MHLKALILYEKIDSKKWPKKLNTASIIVIEDLQASDLYYFWYIQMIFWLPQWSPLPSFLQSL